jgi:hypothetical protein
VLVADAKPHFLTIMLTWLESSLLLLGDIYKQGPIIPKWKLVWNVVSKWNPGKQINNTARILEILWALHFSARRAELCEHGDHLEHLREEGKSEEVINRLVVVGGFLLSHSVAFSPQANYTDWATATVDEI